MYLFLLHTAAHQRIHVTFGSLSQVLGRKSSHYAEKK